MHWEFEQNALDGCLDAGLFYTDDSKLIAKDRLVDLSRRLAQLYRVCQCIRT